MLTDKADPASTRMPVWTVPLSFSVQPYALCQDYSAPGTPAFRSVARKYRSLGLQLSISLECVMSNALA